MKWNCKFNPYTLNANVINGRRKRKDDSPLYHNSTVTLVLYGIFYHQISFRLERWVTRETCDDYQGKKGVALVCPYNFPLVYQLMSCELCATLFALLIHGQIRRDDRDGRKRKRMMMRSRTMSKVLLWYLNYKEEWNQRWHPKRFPLHDLSFLVRK